MSQQAVHTRPRMVTGTVPLRRAASRARRSVNRAVHTAAKNAGLSGVHAHLLRHLAGSMALEDGASVAEVAEMLGDTIAEVQKPTSRRCKADGLASPQQPSATARGSATPSRRAVLPSTRHG
jgi:integrase